MNLHEWAHRWGVPAAALEDLRLQLGLDNTVPASQRGVGHNEDAVQVAVRFEAARKGLLVWRNNVGALKDATGRVVRYGLANDSTAVNKKIKSGDLIGVRPVTITPAHVGQVIGQFVSRECKAHGWFYTGADREPAQLAWANLVLSVGGDAAFTTGEGTL